MLSIPHLTLSGCFVGQNYSWGVIQTKLVSDKLSSPATLSFVGAVAIGCISIFALINALTMRRLGARFTCLVGVGFISLGQMVSSFAYKNVGGLFITAGLITGFGTSLCFMVGKEQAALTSRLSLHFHRSTLCSKGELPTASSTQAVVLAVPSSAYRLKRCSTNSVSPGRSEFSASSPWPSAVRPLH